MSAEQHKHLHFHERSFAWIPESIRKVLFTRIRQFDASPAFEKYFADLSKGVDALVARRRMMQLLEANLRSFTQEGIGDPDINEYGFEIMKSENLDRLVLRSLLYEDTQKEQKEKILSEENLILRERYVAEFSAWERIWNELLPSVEQLIGSDTATVIKNIEAQGFKRRVYDPALESSDPVENRNSPNRLSDVTRGLAALFPQLEGVKHVEIYEHPTKYSFVSPRFSFYHQGETSIARIARLVYIPKINSFAFLESGLFTAYKNQEIAQFLTLDGRDDAPQFDSPKELLDVISVLTEEFSAQAPHAVFQTIIAKLGHFPQVPVGDNVIREGSRDLSTQLSFLEKIFEFETTLMWEHPSTTHRLRERLELASEPILHSLLRNRALDVNGQLQNYISNFSDLSLAQNPRAAKNTFREGVVAVHPDFSTQVLSLIDCGTGSFIGGIKPSLSGMEMRLSAPQLLSRIEQAERSDIATWDELVEFCKPFGIPPEWFHRNTTGEECVRCHRTDRNWMGECSMCPQCNARFNLQHGLTGAEASDELQEFGLESSPTDEESSIYRIVGIGDALSAATTGDWEQFQVEVYSPR